MDVGLAHGVRFEQKFFNWQKLRIWMGLLLLEVNESRGVYSMGLTNRSVRSGVFGVGAPKVYSAGWGCMFGVYWAIGGLLLDSRLLKYLPTLKTSCSESEI